MTPVGPPCQPHSYRHRCPDKKSLLEQHYALEHGLSVDLSPVYRQRGVAESVAMYAGPYSHLNTPHVRTVSTYKIVPMNPQLLPRQICGNWCMDSPRRQARGISARGRARRGRPSPASHARGRCFEPCRTHQEPRPRCPRPPPSSAVRCSGSLCWAASGRSATAPPSATPRPTECRVARHAWRRCGARSAPPGADRGAAPSTARAMLCSTYSGAAAPASAAIGRRDGGRCRAALVDRARSRGQRPSVLCEIRSQPWIV